MRAEKRNDAARKEKSPRIHLYRGSRAIIAGARGGTRTHTPRGTRF